MEQKHISILNHVYVLQIHEKTKLKKGPTKKQQLVVSMLLILPDVIRHFKGPRMH